MDGRPSGRDLRPRRHDPPPACVSCDEHALRGPYLRGDLPDPAARWEGSGGPDAGFRKGAGGPQFPAFGYGPGPVDGSAAHRSGAMATAPSMDGNHRMADFARGADLRDRHRLGFDLPFHETRMIHAGVTSSTGFGWVGSVSFDARIMQTGSECALFLGDPDSVLFPPGRFDRSAAGGGVWRRRHPRAR